MASDAISNLALGRCQVEGRFALIGIGVKLDVIWDSARSCWYNIRYARCPSIVVIRTPTVQPGFVKLAPAHAELAVIADGKAGWL